MDDQLDMSLPDPRAPHDDLSFEELSRRYNFERTSHDWRVFTRLAIKECQKRGGRAGGVATLDVGCGHGIGLRQEYQWALREVVADYWGVEPDPNQHPPDGLFDHHRWSSMEQADLPANHFDVVYSAMVMEHVTDPDAFMRAVHRCLKPGGVYLFLTPNGRHYFTRIASLARRLGQDERLLRLSVKEEELAYHYPVEYRFNNEKVIDACADRLGFEPPEYVYLEAKGPIGYFPGPTKVMFHALAAKRRRIRNSKALIAMVCRITKSSEACRSDTGCG